MVCLETTFAVDLLRGNKIAKEKLTFLESIGEKLTIASPTIAELISGAILNPKNKNERENVIGLISSFNVLSLDKDSAIKSGEIEAELIRRGEPIQTDDIMIGAIALQNNEALVTRNKKHFERIKGLKIEEY